MPARKIQGVQRGKALNRPEIKSAPFAVVFCHIPLFNTGGNSNGCCGHEHYHRWDEPTGFRWKQVLGGGPELGYGAGFVPDKNHYPTIIEGVVENGKLVIRTHDVWRNRIVDKRIFEQRA